VYLPFDRAEASVVKEANSNLISMTPLLPAAPALSGSLPAVPRVILLKGEKNILPGYHMTQILQSRLLEVFW
jgi:hypothetical protein